MGRKKVSDADRTDQTDGIYFRVTPELKKIIEYQAAVNNISVSQHIRSALALDACLSGNVDAVKLVFSSASTTFKDDFRALYNKSIRKEPVLE